MSHGTPFSMFARLITLHPPRFIADLRADYEVVFVGQIVLPLLIYAGADSALQWLREVAMNDAKSLKAFKYFLVDLGDVQPFSLDLTDSQPESQRHAFLTKCLNDNLIERESPIRDLVQRYRKPELQVICREYGLSAIGVKADLISRLQEGAPEWVRKETEFAQFWRLTATGHELAWRFAQEIGAESGALEAKLMSLLLQGKTVVAWRAWADWEASEPYKILPETEWPYNIGYRPFSEVDFVRVAEEAFSVLEHGEAASFLAALLMNRHLLFEQSALTQQNQTSHAVYLMSLRECPGVIGVRIHQPKHHNCVFAKAYAGDYRLEDVPLLPPSLCNNEPGCLCWMTGIFELEAMTVDSWKKPIRRDPNAGPPIVRPPEPLTEAGIRRLAVVLNSTCDLSIDESAIQSSIRNAQASGMLAETRQETALPPAPALPKGLVKRAACQQSAVAEGELAESLNNLHNALSEKPKTLAIPPPEK